MTRNEGQASVILDNVCKLIQKKVHADNVLLVEKFAKALYSNMSKEDLANRNDSDLYGAALSLWNSLEKNTTDDAVIRVFNPEVAKDGWQSSHTIVEIIAKDMPFLVDSIRIALNRLGLSPHLMLNSPLKLIRDKKQQITQLSSAIESTIKATSQETIFFIEIDRQSTEQELKVIKDELLSVVEDISLTVTDWQPMLNQLNVIIGDVKKAKLPGTKEAKETTVEFLEWLAANHFTLMGYRSYDVKAVQGDKQFFKLTLMKISWNQTSDNSIFKLCRVLNC